MDDILLKLAILAAMLGFAAAWNYIAWRLEVRRQERNNGQDR
jgi:hypothetical protein